MYVLKHKVYSQTNTIPHFLLCLSLFLLARSSGVDWAQVAAFVDHGRKYATFTGQRRHKHSKILRMLLKLQRCCCPWIPASWTKTLNRHAGNAAPHKSDMNGKPGPPGNHHSHHSRRGSSLGSEREMTSLNPRAGSGQGDLESGFTGALDGRLAGGVAGRELTAVAADGMSESPRLKANMGRSSSLGTDGIHERTGGTPALNHAPQRHRKASKGKQSSKRASRGSKTHKPSSGTASDDDSSSRSGGKNVSERSSVSSSSDSEDDGLLRSVLPGIRTSEIDILMQECPFMGARYANQAKGNASSGAAAAAAAAAGPGAGSSDAAANMRRGPNGLVSRFWAPRSRKALLNQPAQQVDLELQQQQQQEGEGEQQPLPPKMQPSTAAIADQPHLPLTPPLSGDGSLSRGSAGAAAAAAAQQTADYRSRPRSGGAGTAVRSLATRSAAPAFVYGSRKPAEGSGLPEAGEYSGPQHVRRGSSGAAVIPEGPAAAGFSKPGSWGLAGMAMESTAAAAGGAGPGGLLAEVEWSAGSPRSVIRSPFQIQTDKALGRQSGVTKGLATRSVNLGGDRFGGGAVSDAIHCSAQHPHLPEDSEAAMHVTQCDDGYDAAAAAVDMVSLARNSRKAGQAPAAAAAGGGGGGGGPARSRSRGLASRSVGMPGVLCSTTSNGLHVALPAISRQPLRLYGQVSGISILQSGRGFGSRP